MLSPRRIWNPGAERACVCDKLSPAIYLRIPFQFLSSATSTPATITHLPLLPPSSKHLLSHPLQPDSSPGKHSFTALPSSSFSVADQFCRIRTLRAHCDSCHCIFYSRLSCNRSNSAVICNPIPYRQELQPTTIRRGPSLSIYRSIPKLDLTVGRLVGHHPIAKMPPRSSLTSSFSITDANNEVVCPLRNQDGSSCRKRCTGVRPSLPLSHPLPLPRSPILPSPAQPSLPSSSLTCCCESVMLDRSPVLAAFKDHCRPLESDMLTIPLNNRKNDIAPCKNISDGLILNIIYLNSLLPKRASFS